MIAVGRRRQGCVAAEGRVQRRLVPDPVRGPVVTTIFTWQALERLSYQAIADRLNADPERYRRRIRSSGNGVAGSGRGR